MLKFTSLHLNKLLKQNSFPLPPEDIVLFGFRGCSPVWKDDNEFRQTQAVQINPINYYTMNCTIGIWFPDKQAIACFTGSTVPHKSNIEKAMRANGMGTNQMMTGYFQYEKGIHKPGTPTGHQALIQKGSRPHRRTANNSSYGNDDRVEYGNPWDNMHSAWSMGGNSGFASAGCQVIMGFPKCQRNPDNLGPWKEFHDIIYGSNQKTFSYFLLDASDLNNVVNSRVISNRLRYGSKSLKVKELQDALIKKGIKDINCNGIFDWKTLQAVLTFQERTFGKDSDDGIVGEITASALGISLLS